jgi:hypothetical protein
MSRPYIQTHAWLYCVHVIICVHVVLELSPIQRGKMTTCSGQLKSSHVGNFQIDCFSSGDKLSIPMAVLLLHLL